MVLRKTFKSEPWFQEWFHRINSLSAIQVQIIVFIEYFMNCVMDVKMMNFIYLFSPSCELAFLACMEGRAAVSQVGQEQPPHRLGGRQSGSDGRTQQRPMAGGHPRLGLRVVCRLYEWLIDLWPDFNILSMNEFGYQKWFWHILYIAFVIYKSVVATSIDKENIENVRYLTQYKVSLIYLYL